MRWLTYYLPKQYFEALAKATSSSRITGRYVVKHFVRGGFAKSDAQCWLPGTKLKRTSKLLTSLPHWLRFFFHSITVPFGSATFSLPKLVGKSASPTRSCNTTFLFPIGRHIHMPGDLCVLLYLHNAADIEIVSYSFALIRIFISFRKSWWNLFLSFRQTCQGFPWMKLKIQRLKVIKVYVKNVPDQRLLPEGWALKA